MEQDTKVLKNENNNIIREQNKYNVNEYYSAYSQEKKMTI